MSAEMYEEDIGGRGMVTRKRLSGKKLVLFVLAPAVLVIAGAAGLYFSGVLSSLSGKPAAEQTSQIEKPIVISYYDLPDMLVNLRTDGPRPSFLKISVSLEIEHADDKLALDRILPRVIDTFQVYLRELRVDQLQGSAGLLRLREELLSRVNAAARPVKVRDVLFKEMLVQ